MKDEIDFNKGWNDAVRGMANAKASGTLHEYFAKINKASATIKMTHYFKGVFAAIQEYQESVMAPDMVAA